MMSKILQGRLAPTIFACAVMGMVVVGGGSALAQDQRPEVRLSVEGGIDGWVHPSWPMTLHARIESDILLVGELLVVQGQGVIRVEVEVPANGVRSYEVVMSPPTAGGGAVIVRVIPEGSPDDQPAASVLFRPRVAEEELLVGLVDLPRLGQVLGEVRSAVSGVPITPVAVEHESPQLEEGDLYQLSYLVMDQPRPLTPATASWLEGGGRLITTFAALESMGLDVTFWDLFPGVDEQIAWYGVGDGEVLALDSLSGRENRLWALLLRPPPLALGEYGNLDSRGRASLTQAALSSDPQIPSYPWLPVVVVVYALVVGPLNLWILRRRRRSEWAWVTIPVLGLAGVVAFWIVGAGGVNQTFLSHGTVKVAGPVPVTRSGVVAATSRAASFELIFDSDWEVFPYTIDDLPEDAAPPSISGAGVYRYDLPSLGWLSVNAFRRGEPVEADLVVSEQGLELVNNTSTDIAAWGVHSFPKVLIGEGVPAGQSGSLSWESVLRAGSYHSFGDAFWEQGMLGDNPWEGNGRWPEVIGALENTARWSGMVDAPFYVFAVAEETITDISVNGRYPPVEGLTLTLFPIPAEQMAEAGWAYPRPVWLDNPPGQQNFDPNFVFAEQWIVSYRLPRGLSTPLRLELGGFIGFEGGFDRFVADNDSERTWEAWDWDATEFFPIDVGVNLDPERFLAPSGEMLVRAFTSDAGVPLSVDAIVEWGDLEAVVDIPVQPPPVQLPPVRTDSLRPIGDSS